MSDSMPSRMKLNEEKEEGPNRVTHGLGTYEWNKCYGMWFQGCRELHWGSNHTQWMGLSISIANFFEFFQDSIKCDGEGDALIAEPEKEREMTRACEHVSSSLYSWGCFKSGFLFVRFDDGAKVSFPSGVSLFDPASVIFLPSFFCNFSSIFPSALAFLHFRTLLSLWFLGGSEVPPPKAGTTTDLIRWGMRIVHPNRPRGQGSV